MNLGRKLATIFPQSFIQINLLTQRSKTFVTRRRPKALTRDVWVSERITGMLDGNGS